MRSGPPRDDTFYRDTLKHMIRENVLSPAMRVVVACGGTYDRDILCDLGFKDVTITNLDSRLKGTEFAPYEWSYQDVEQLTFANDSFDFAIVHNGLHHCFSPHHGLLELYRVAKYGVLAFEPRDTLLVRIGVKLNFGQTYELAAVSHNGMQFGGVGNTQIPNFIYRWTEREFEKTIQTYAPVGPHRFVYAYAMRVPWSRLTGLRNPLFGWAVWAGLPILRLVFRLFPRQANGFAFAVQKPRLPNQLHPWLRFVDGRPTVNQAWIDARYHRREGQPGRE
jgi:SAM-dependent methyltransferase